MLPRILLFCSLALIGFSYFGTQFYAFEQAELVEDYQDSLVIYKGNDSRTSQNTAKLMDSIADLNAVIAASTDLITYNNTVNDLKGQIAELEQDLNNLNEASEGTIADLRKELESCKSKQPNDVSQINRGVKIVWLIPNGQRSTSLQQNVFNHINGYISAGLAVNHQYTNDSLVAYSQVKQKSTNTLVIVDARLYRIKNKFTNASTPDYAVLQSVAQRIKAIKNVPILLLSGTDLGKSIELEGVGYIIAHDKNYAIMVDKIIAQLK